MHEVCEGLSGHLPGWPYVRLSQSIRPPQTHISSNFSYTDLTGEFTAALYGHSNPVILSAINNVLQNVGMNVGATTAQEQVFARELCSRFDLEHIRFANSGTEANIHALAAARAFTKKRKVVVFGGGYHGAVLGFAGDKPGANNVDMDDWIIARYNDLESAQSAISSEGVAAVLVEGMQGAGGGIDTKPGFLEGIQDAAAKVRNPFHMACHH